MIISSRGLFDQVPNCYQSTWGDFVAYLQLNSGSVERVKENISLVSFAAFDGQGGRKENVTSVSGLMLDYDGTTHEQLAEVVGKAQRFRGAAYTTYSHAIKGDPPCRFRVVVPLDQPCPPADYEHVWLRFARMLGVYSVTAPDRKTRDVTRFSFVPAINPNGPPPWFAQWDGPLLKLADMVLPDPAGPEATLIESELEQSERVSVFDLQRLGHTLAKKSSTEHQTLGRALLTAMRGEQYAMPNYRNDVTYRLAGEIAKAFPRADSQDLSEHFRAAFEIQGEPTCEIFANMLRRQQLRHQQFEYERRALRQLRKAEGIAEDPRDPAPQPAEGVIAGLPLIVQRDGFYWLREPNSPDYSEVYGSKDVKLAIFRKYSSAIDLYGAEGQPLGLETVLLTYSQVVRQVEADYLATQTSYDPEHARLNLATAPRRAILPAYQLEVDTWLRALGGRCYEDLVAWIQGLAFLHRPSPALYLWGNSGAGKTLLATGLARIWQHPMTGFSQAIDNFNSALARNPLVLADEGFPPETKFTWLRSFLSTSSREVNEKFRPQYTLRGHVRLFVTANNPAAFEFGRRYLTAQDAQAIGERVIQIEVTKESRAYLESLGDVSTWVTEDKIAQHALWLMQQPAQDQVGRWAVTPKHADKNAFEGSLVDARYAWFVAWLADYLSTPRKIEGRFATGNPDGWLMRTESGVLLVSADAFRYIDRCEASEFKHALRFFSKGPRVRLRVPGNPRRMVTYREIDITRFHACAQDHVDDETMVTTIAEDTRKRVNV